VIPDRVRTITELGLPPVIERIAEEQRGLILVTGTTGSGKSTTLAAMIDHINSKRGGHIITIEDPIEFLHRDRKSFVTQREVDVDTRSFAEALRGALRQDPDVILVGEMRDSETIETALTAAETGHLVLSTLHTLDATETIRRIVSSFPPHLQKSVRIQLAGILRAVISMRLVRAADGAGRVPSAEVMISTGLIRDYIINEEKTSLIRDAIAAGTSQYGMQTFDQSLFTLHQSGLISLEEAMRGASNPDEFRMRVSGIRSASDQAREDMERVTSITNGAQRER
jgi:twitching motility protein PilT